MLKLKVYVFLKKDNGLCRQRVRLNPSLALYSGNCESSNLHTTSVRNFQLVLYLWSLHPEATSQKLTSPLGTVICTSGMGRISCGVLAKRIPRKHGCNREIVENGVIHYTN